MNTETISYQATVHFAGENDNTEHRTNCWATIILITPIVMILFFIIVVFFLLM